MPVLGTLFPAALLVICIFPEKFIGWGLITGLIAYSGLTILLGQLGRDLGYNLEPTLFKSWGGAPAETALNLDKTWLNKTTVKRAHDSLDEMIPGGPHDWADAETIESVVNWLFANTRHIQLVNQENINYGARRNLYGLKPVALTIVCVSIAIVLLMTGFPLPAENVSLNDYHEWWKNMPPATMMTLILDAIALFIWIFVIKRGWVHLAAKALSKQIVMATDKIYAESKSSPHIPSNPGAGS